MGVTLSNLVLVGVISGSPSHSRSTTPTAKVPTGVHGAMLNDQCDLWRGLQILSIRQQCPHAMKPYTCNKVWDSCAILG